MAHQSNRVTPFTHGLIQTAKRNETHGMDARSPKSLKVALGRGEWFVRKPHLFQDDVKQCESVLCLFRLPALFVCWFEPINNPSLRSSVSVINLLLYFHSQLLFSHKLTSGGGRKHFSSFDFVVWVWWQQLESGWKAISSCYSAICWQSAPGTVIQKRAPDGVAGVMTTPAPLCSHYLVWLNFQSPGFIHSMTLSPQICHEE